MTDCDKLARRSIPAFGDAGRGCVVSLTGRVPGTKPDVGSRCRQRDEKQRDDLAGDKPAEPKRPRGEIKARGTEGWGQVASRTTSRAPKTRERSSHWHPSGPTGHACPQVSATADPQPVRSANGPRATISPQPIAARLIVACFIGTPPGPTEENKGENDNGN